MTVKLITYIGPVSDYAPRAAFQYLGGALLPNPASPTEPLLFHTVREAVEWAKKDRWTLLLDGYVLGTTGKGN